MATRLYLIRRAAGRSRMARTGSPPAPGSQHRGSVGGHPRYGGRAACPPAPSDSPSLGTHEGDRRPALYGGTSARSALAPYAPFVLTVPHLGDNPTPIGSERHPAFYTLPASRHDGGGHRPRHRRERARPASGRLMPPPAAGRGPAKPCAPHPGSCRARRGTPCVSARRSARPSRPLRSPCVASP